MLISRRAGASRCPTACAPTNTRRVSGRSPVSRRRSRVWWDRSRVPASSRRRPSSCSKDSISTRSSIGTARAAARAIAPDGRLRMLRVRYTAWDGTQQIRLTAEQLFDKLGDFLSYTDDVQQALDWEGIRVQGLDELLEQLRNAMRERMQDVHLRDAFAELRQRLEDLLEDEREALDQAEDSERIRNKRA